MKNLLRYLVEKILLLDTTNFRRITEVEVVYHVIKRRFLPQASDPMRMSALTGPTRTKLILLRASGICVVGLLSRIFFHTPVTPTPERFDVR